MPAIAVPAKPLVVTYYKFEKAKMVILCDGEYIAQVCLQGGTIKLSPEKRRHDSISL